MRPRLVHDIARLGFAGSGVAAIAYQYASLAPRPEFRPANFFSFFTIQSNVLAVAVLALAALVRRDERSRAFDAVRTAVTLYMAITGVVFAVLLAGLQESLDTHIAWVNFVVHTLQPVVLAVDWLLDPPRARPSWSVAAAWLAFPVAWFAYTLVRGAQVGWYPYPFVDVGQHGYGRVLVNAVVLALAFALAAAVFRLVAVWRAR